MKINLAETAGFCFGVDRAVKLVERAISEGTAVCTLGPVIHNRFVTAHFAAQGAREISDPTQAPPGSIVIIRSHGETKETYDRLQAMPVTVMDATCPYVRRIQKLVSGASEQGQRVIILGKRDHPEVIGVASWCNDPLIFETPDEVALWTKNSAVNWDFPTIVVSQTTNTKDKLKCSVNFLKKQCTNLKIYDTICDATENRQKEAAALSKSCEAMIVIGDRNSSNTRNLAEICRATCDQVQLIESCDELDMRHFTGVSTVGITAGASTPPWIIKEVNNKMSEETIVEGTQEVSFAEMLEQSFKTLNNGDRVTGVITSITPTEIYVDLGTKHAGYIPTSEFNDVKVEEAFKPGDEIEVVVVRVNDGEGTVMLSKKRLDAVKFWDEIEKVCEDKQSVEGTITEQNKGGLVADVKGVRVFIPASQTGIPKNGDLGTLLHKTTELKITEVNRGRRRVVGSIRAVGAESRKAASEKIWSEIEVGKEYEGTVKSLTSYGAFVDIGGVDGMVHVSELSWNRIKNPADVVSVGDVIKVHVIALDPEKKKISLGYKTAENNPWAVFTTNYQVGDVITAKVVRMMDFGAFAEIIPGVDGLIHISQIADHRIGKPSDVLTEGQDVEAKIIDIDTEKKRISLSIRALLEGGEEQDSDEE
ncbi:MAG: bifunctional 4-hydroxy-3-methylbut-2-enyl diphosphate reductase/30S ribosomal protein S1 [Oscillospiraceae bacterium]|nr:bifunctional 4-hydroxy-3-methylbut-2-enyl diphosphate reductase/30S ribosomal protein S1 [Oscillospiraceae bacterium]